MKHVLIVLFACFTLPTLGQVQHQKVQVQERIIERNLSFTLNDTIIDVIYNDKQFEDEAPAYFINSVFADWISGLTVNPEAIKDVKVIKKDTTIRKKDYHHQLHIQTHDSIPVHLMTLSEIKKKYTKSTASKCIYVLNNRFRNNEEFITSNPDLKIDKNYVFRIKVDQLNFAGRKPKKSEKLM